MKRLAALLFLLFAIPTWATTTVTGHIVDLGTISATPNAFVRFTLRGCGGNQPTVPGVGILAPTQGAVWFKDFPANSSGNISGTIYSSRDATGLLGGDIQCGGSFTAVWFGMTVWVGGKSGPEVAVHTKNTATLDVSSVTPITMNPVVTAPTGDSTYARLDGGNTPFFGNISFTNQMNANGGGNFSGTFTGNPTLSGNPTFSGTPVFSNGASLAGTFSGNHTYSGLPTFSAGIAGNGGNLLYPLSSCPTTSINGQNNITCNWLPVSPSSGATQQVAFGASITGASTSQLGPGNFRIGGFFGATTGAGGESILALNAVSTAVNGQPAANTQIFQAAINNNQSSSALNCVLPACYTGFSVASSGSGIASIAFNVSGTGQWQQGYEIDQGSIATNGYAFDYKGDGTNGNVIIRSDSTEELGFASTLGGHKELHLSNNAPIQGLNAAASAVIPIVKVNASNVLEFDTSTVGSQFDGAVADNGTLSVGGGNAINKILRGNGISLNSAFTSISAGSCQTQTLTLAGATGGVAMVNPTSSVGLFSLGSVFVSGSNTITVTLCSTSGGTPTGVTWNAVVIQ